MGTLDSIPYKIRVKVKNILLFTSEMHCIKMFNFIKEFINKLLLLFFENTLHVILYRSVLSYHEMYRSF